MKRNVSLVNLCLYVSECVCSKIIKELPGLVGSGTSYIRHHRIKFIRNGDSAGICAPMHYIGSNANERQTADIVRNYLPEEYI